MKNMKLLLVTIFGVFACVLHAVILNTPFNFYVYSSAAKIILFVLFPLVCLRISKDIKLRDLFAPAAEKTGLRLSFLCSGGVFALIISAFIILRSFLNQEAITAALSHNGITAGNFPLVFIYIVLINAVLEEIFFRGMCFYALYRAGYKAYAHIFSSLLFAVYHVAILNNALSVLMFILCISVLAVGGLIFNYFVVKCKNILGSLIVHISANLALNLIVLSYLL